jgi:uncharacterized protein (TIGR00297 family)
METYTAEFIIVLFAAMFASYKYNKLTLAAALTGGLIATSIFAGAGFTGIGMLATFFITATLATSHGKKDKQKLTTELITHQEVRNTGQVLANGATAGIFGLLMYLIPVYAPLFAVLIASSLASATADTLSSELGTVYGRRFYNIITLKPDEKGRDGVISLEGILIGIGGAVLISFVYALGFGFSINYVYIIIAGSAGNIADSVAGATLERKGVLNNDAVNLLNTTVAPLIAWLLIQL